MHLENNKDNIILIIAVIYNSYKDTIRFIKGFEKFKEKNLSIILVDNSNISPIDEFTALLKETKLNLGYIKSVENSGYFGGAKIGYENYIRFNDHPQWVIVTNVDIVFNSPDFFEEFQKLHNIPNLGVIAPAIISKTWEVDLNPKITERYSRKKMIFYKYITISPVIQNTYILLSYLKKYSKRLLTKKHSETKIVNDKPRKIYAPHGSCIIFHKNYFDKGGNFNHISFLFGEEIFVAETALKTGLDVVYFPGLKLLDYEHASTGFFYSKKISDLMHVSTIDILKNYY